MGTPSLFWLFVILSVTCFIVHGLGGSSSTKISFRDFGFAFGMLAYGVKG